MKKIIVILFIFSGIYAQCEDYDQLACNNNNNCNWVEDIEIINCSTLPTYGWGVGSCDYYYPDCYEYLDYGGSYGSWSTECGGGIVQIDNSYCEEVECPAMSYNQCNNSDICSWIEEIDYIDCDNLSDYNSCSANYDNGCQWILMHWQQQNEANFCTGPTFQIYNSYCLDSELLDCNQMDQSQCSSNDDCDWYLNTTSNDCTQFNSYGECSNNGCDWETESITASCYSNQWESGFANSSECNAIPGCYWDCSDWYTWACDCEGAYEVNISSCNGVYDDEAWSCDELQYANGDVNFDWTINVLDVVALVDIILSGNEYSSTADTNYDGSNNILDVILLVSLILEGV